VVEVEEKLLLGQQALVFRMAARVEQVFLFILALLEAAVVEVVNYRIVEMSEAPPPTVVAEVVICGILVFRVFLQTL
jgi:hypothetical protein